MGSILKSKIKKYAYGNMETAVDYRRHLHFSLHYNASIRKLKNKSDPFFAVDIYCVFVPHTYSRRHLENDVIGATLWHYVLRDARTFKRHGFYGSLP